MSDIVSPKIHKSLKIRLYPSENQEILFNKAFGCCRFVYNRHKEEKDNFYNENIKDKNLSKKEIQELYKTFKPKTQKEFCDEFEWLREIPAITVTDTIRKCDNAYSNFFNSLSGKRKGRKVGFPKFKSRKDKNQSFSVYMLSKNCLDWEHRLINLLVDEIKSTLGMERTEVMSMEDIEVNLFNGEIYGVSYEVENQNSDVLKEAFCFS